MSLHDAVEPSAPITITLSSAELMIAATVGSMRRVMNLRDGRKPRYGFNNEENAWTVDVEAACGEMAVAKAMGIYWNGAIGNLRADDVGSLQVRMTIRDDGRLILHKEDLDDRAFVLVTGRSPTFALRGWIMARDGKRPEFWHEGQTGRPAFFVPVSALRSMDDLK